jgi:beta-glucosidase
LDYFSVQKDRDAHIIDTIHGLQRIAREVGVDSEVRLFASVWSPPGWMKTPTAMSESFPSNKKLLKGGAFDDAHIQDLARYLARFCEEYAKEGVPIHALTMQNEPLLEVDYPSMFMSPVQQAAVAVDLRTLLDSSAVLGQLGIAPELWAFDHNLDDARQFLQGFDQRSLAALSGIAIHDYEGDLEVMTELKDAYPQKTVHLTERSVWGTEGADRIVRYFRNWCSSYNAWVTMLDSNIGPHQFWMTPDTTLYVRRQFSSDEFWATPDLYMLGNFARFVRPGYVRIESDYGSIDTLSSVAFLDPSEQTVVLVLINQTALDQQGEVEAEDRRFRVDLPAESVGTFVWSRSDESKH